MIVICQRCQAKFRVPDEKIPLRGAKVRCSKCQAVFVVHRDSAALDVELEPRPRSSPPPLPSGATDPFASAAADPFAPTAFPRDDPFAAAALAQASGAAASAPRAARDAFAGDPFPGDPFGESTAFGEDPSPRPPAELLAEATEDGLVGEPARTGSARLAVTDLSDLLGEAGVAAAPPPLPRRPEVKAAPAGEDSPGFASSGSDPGIALEERETPPAFHAPGAAFEAGLAAEGFAGGLGDPRSFQSGNLDLPPPDGDSLALATERTPASPALAPDPWGSPRPVRQAPPDARKGAPAPPRPRAGQRAGAAAGLEPGPVDRIPGGRSSPLRTAIVNAVALAALVLVALAVLVLWRGDVSSEALRPAAILAALRRGGAPAGPFAASDLRNGLYEREKAHPLLFVRGTAVARPGAPDVGAVRVEVELVKDGAVVARGEGVAGALPTPEELWRAADGAALSAVVARARARAPAKVRSGDAVPFLVVIADYPGDLSDAAVHVTLAPVKARR